MVNGGWLMVDGRWSMVDGQWLMGNGFDALKDRPSPSTIDHQPSTINHPPLTINHQPSTMRISERARNAAPSPTLAITAKVNQLKSQGVDVVGFGAGEPDFDTPAPIKEAAIEALRAGFTKYTASAGIEELRAAICDKLRRDNGLDYAPKQIIVSVGAKHSLYNLFQAVLDPGDEVIIPAPYWVSYPEQVKLADGAPVFAAAREADGFRAT